MEHLLDPDTGLVIWTIATFLLLLVVLGKFAWGPMVKTLNEREMSIRRAIEEAEAAKIAASQMREQYEKDLAHSQEKIHELMRQATIDAQQVREKLVKDAEEEAQRLSALSKRQLAEEKEKVLLDIRKEVAAISVQAAEKLIRHSMGAKAQDVLLQGFFDDLDKRRAKDSLH
jgi:F-type H+-transporting ATPase subunit b